jgi:hypothetical protein
LASVLFSHMRENGLNASQRTVEIDFHKIMHVIQQHVRHGRPHPQAGVVDEDVHAAKLCDYDGHQPANVLVLGHVGGNSQDGSRPGRRREAAASDDFVRYFAQGWFVAGSEDHTGTGPGKSQSGFASDATGGTGNDDYLVFEASAHIFTSRRRGNMLHGNRLHCQRMYA